MQMYEINVDFKNKESLVNALNDLTEQMLKNFEYAKNSNYYMSENYLPIINNNHGNITKEQLFDNDILEEVLSLTSDLSKNNLFNINKDYVDNSLNVFTQCYLIHKALKFGLEEEVLDFARKILDFCIEVNDSDVLWYDDCNVYGIDILATIALNNPKHIYLISEYIVPYWDEEHASYVFEYLRYFHNKHSFSKDMLKAFAYCHSLENLTNVFLYVDNTYVQVVSGKLFEHFKENTDDYDYYKSQFFEYLEKYPRSNEDEECVHLSTKIFRIIVGEDLEERSNEAFYGKTIEEHVEIFSDEINEVLDKYTQEDYPFVRYEDGEYEDIEDYEEDTLDSIRINEEFFIKGLRNGNKIYDYVLYGKNPEVLDSIEKIKYLNSFAHENNLMIAKRFDYYGTNFLSDITEHFITQQLECEVKESFFGKLLNKNYDTNPKQRALRAVDVLFRIYGQELDEFTSKQLTVEYELCSLDEVFRRYSIYSSKEELVEKIQGLMNKFYRKSLSIEELEQINALFLADKSLWDQILETVMFKNNIGLGDDILEVMPELSQAHIKGAYLTAVAFMIFKNHNDKSLELNKLFKFYEENVFTVFRNILKENGRTTYYKENSLMDQSYLIDEIIDYCANSSYNYEKISENIKELSFLNDGEKHTKHLDYEMGINMIGLFSSDDIQALLSSIVYIYKYASKQLQEKIQRVYFILLDLAPVKTIHETSKSFFEFHKSMEIDNNSKIYNSFISTLENMNVKKEYIIAWEINRSINNKYIDFCEEKLNYYVSKYIAKDENTYKSIEYVDFIARRDFYKQINEIEKSDEYFNCCKIQFDVMNYDFAKRRTKWENPEWNMEKDEKERYHKQILENANLIEQYLFNNAPFEKIEDSIIDPKDPYASSDLSKIIHYFDKEIQHRYLYLICRIGHISRVYDYVRVAYEDEFETYGLTHKLFYLMTNIGVDKSFALLFILDQAKSEAQYAEDEEDKNFIKALLDIYTDIGLYDVCKNYKENKIIFILREISKDDDISNQKAKIEILEQFTKHDKLKVQKVAKSFLGV